MVSPVDGTSSPPVPKRQTSHRHPKLNTRVPAELQSQLAHLAEAADVSKTVLVLIAVEELLSRYEVRTTS